jgi:hypothetical protein
MKAGTTWLYRQLEQHPDIRFSREKELHFLAYLDGDQRALSKQYRLTRARNALHQSRRDQRYPTAKELLWYAGYVLRKPNWQWYQARFDSSTQGQYLADFSNLTAVISEESWRTVQAAAENLRVLYLVRHPLQRIWSQLKFQHQQQGNSGLPDSVDDDAAAELLRHSAYGSNLATILKVLPENEVLAVNYDNISAEPLALLRRIEQFLQLTPHEYDSAKLRRVINPSLNGEVPDWVVGKFAGPCIQELQKLADLGFPIPESWKQCT